MSGEKSFDGSDELGRYDKRGEPMNEQEAKLALIEIGVQAFCDEYLNDRAEEPLDNLWEAAKECSSLNLSHGDPEGWVAAIAYAFARINHLFDDEGPMHLDRDEFFEFFDGCNRSTVRQKATRIEKTLECDDHPEFCLPEVEEAKPRLMQLPNGMMAPESLFLGQTVGGRHIEIGFMSAEKSEDLARQLEEKKWVQEEEKKERHLEALREKRAEERRTQPELFDLGD